MALTNTNPNTICLDVGSSSKLLEGIVGTGWTLYPGNIIQYHIPDGVMTAFNGVAESICPLMVVVENLNEGKTITDSYAAGTKVYFRHMRAGDSFLATRATGVIELGEPLGVEQATGYVTTIIADNFNLGVVIAMETLGAGSDGDLIRVFAK